MKILATIHKEFLLLIRDPGGLALIFLMPAALVVVMALIQDAPFRDYQEMSLDVLFVNNDNDSLGNKIQDAFQTTKGFHIIIRKDSNEVKKLIRTGAYKAALIIPPKTSEILRKDNKELIGKIISNTGFGVPDTSALVLQPVNINLVFDPVIKANYRQTLAGVADKIIANVHSEWVLDELQTQLSSSAAPPKKIKADLSQIITIQQEYASKDNADIITLNSVQHNVPAWTMFAMFFILFPLAGNFIKEREEGSLLRLRLISGSQLPVVAGKFFFYLCVCLVQFALMIAIGIYLMPLLGLNELVLGNNIAGILITACSVAMAATGYALLIAVYFKTPQQALSFGSVSVVILAALGGVWVPVYVMPQVLQQISHFSPLNWGLESFNDLFLRNASVMGILPDLIKLFCFGILTLAASVFIYKSRTVS